MIRTRYALPVLLATLLASCNDKTESRSETAAPLPDGRPLLTAVYKSMGRVFSYHANATLEAGGETATIDGDFGVERVRFTLRRFDGITQEMMVAGSDAFVRNANDSAWTRDTTGSAIGLSQMVTGPAGPKLGLQATDTVETVGNEEVNGVPATHLRLKRGSPIDIWVGTDPTAGGVVRRIRMQTDGMVNGTVTITYSDFNKSFDVQAPEVK